MNLLPHSLLFFLTLLSGANYTILKLLVPEAMLPNAVVFCRVSIGLIFFGIAAFMYRQIKISITGKDALLMILSGFFGVFANQYFFYQGMNITTPINGSIFNLTNPITIVLFSAVLLKESLSVHSIIGMAFAITGALILIDFSSFGWSESTFWGDIFILINAISFGLYVVLVTPLAKKYGVFATAFYTFLAAFFFILPIGIQDFMQTRFDSFSTIHWWSFTYILIGTTLIVYLLNNYLPTITSTQVIASYVYLQPFVASLFAVILGKDELTFRKLGSGILIMIGISWVYYSKRKLTHEKS